MLHSFHTYRIQIYWDCSLIIHTEYRCVGTAPWSYVEGWNSRNQQGCPLIFNFAGNSFLFCEVKKKRAKSTFICFFLLFLLFIDRLWDIFINIIYDICFKSILIRHESCVFVHIFWSHQKSQHHEILTPGLIWANFKHNKARFLNCSFLRGSPIPIWSSVQNPLDIGWTLFTFSEATKSPIIKKF